jgi:hypothetical protein
MSYGAFHSERLILLYYYINLSFVGEKLIFSKGINLPAEAKIYFIRDILSADNSYAILS